MLDMKNDKKEDDFLVTTIVLVFTILIIVTLAFLFYYYALKIKFYSQPEDVLTNLGVASISSSNITDNTKIINFNSPEVLPETIKTGACLTSSIAQPYRDDAFRCLVEDSIFDPCFITSQKGIVFCQMNPLKNESFLIKLTEDLPTFEALVKEQNNWAWFVELEDGTYCAPYTGIKPSIDQEVAYYGCNSAVKGETVVLMGDLMPSGDTWMANKAIIVESGNEKVIKSLEQVKINSVWQ